jgi:hypothetical protein
VDSRLPRAAEPRRDGDEELNVARASSPCLARGTRTEARATLEASR